MSSCNPSTATSDVVFCIAGSSSMFRFQRVIGKIIVLMLCVLVIPVCSQSNQPTCGKRQVNTMFLVTNGAASKEGHWPWHAALYLPLGHQLKYGCGGSIIDRNVILTAAHCLFYNVRPLKNDELSVHVGRVDLNAITPGLQVLAVSELIIHPDFNGPNAAHDIAIIKLASDIIITKFVHPVCVWTTNNDLSQIVGKQGTVIGFGKNERGELPGFLQEASLTVVDNQACLENDRIAYGPILTRNMYCAGGQRGVSACNGDSGGGMYFEVDGTWYLRGLVSSIAGRSNGLCDPSKYTVFTDVSKYTNWISKYIDSPVRPTSQFYSPVRPTNQFDSPVRPMHRIDKDLLLISDVNTIYRVALDGGQSYRVIKGRTLQKFDYDCVERRFYCFDSNGQNKILSKQGADQKPFITKNIGGPIALAVDWVSRRLYWADYEKKTIEVASLENPNVRTVLFSTNIFDPYQITVDPFRNKLYWADIDEKNPKIEWSNLDGTDRQLLVGSPQVERPTSIQIFNATGDLCYIDGTGMNKLKCIDPYSKRIRTIATNLIWTTGLAITDERFYWINRKEIESIDMNGVRQEPITSPLFKTFLYQVKLVTNKCPIIYSPCATNNGGCPENTICLVNAGAPSGKNCIWTST